MDGDPSVLTEQGEVDLWNWINVHRGNFLKEVRQHLLFTISKAINTKKTNITTREIPPTKASRTSTNAWHGAMPVGLRAFSWTKLHGGYRGPTHFCQRSHVEAAMLQKEAYELLNPQQKDLPPEHEDVQKLAQIHESLRNGDATVFPQPHRLLRDIQQKTALNVSIATLTSRRAWFGKELWDLLMGRKPGVSSPQKNPSDFLTTLGVSNIIHAFNDRVSDIVAPHIYPHSWDDFPSSAIISSNENLTAAERKAGLRNTPKYMAVLHRRFLPPGKQELGTLERLSIYEDGITSTSCENCATCQGCDAPKDKKDQPGFVSRTSLTLS